MMTDLPRLIADGLRGLRLTSQETATLSAVGAALSAIFAAGSAAANFWSVREMRRDHLRSLRPILDLTTDAHEIEYRWEVRPPPANGSPPPPTPIVKYWADRDHKDINGQHDIHLRLWLSNLSAQPATNIRATCELVPPFRRRDLPGLNLGSAVGGNPLNYVEWRDGRYWLVKEGGHGGAGWSDSCAAALPLVSHLAGNDEQEVMIPWALLQNLLLLLYREARIAGRMKTTNLYVRPKIVIRLSYETPDLETLFRKYVVDLPITNCGYLLHGVPWDAFHGVRDQWEAFTAIIRPGVLRDGARLPRRLSSREVRRVFRQMHTSAQSYFGFRSETLRHRLRRLAGRAVCRVRQWRNEPLPKHPLDDA